MAFHCVGRRCVWRCSLIENGYLHISSRKIQFRPNLWHSEISNESNHIFRECSWWRWVLTYWGNWNDRQILYVLKFVIDKNKRHWTSIRCNCPVHFNCLATIRVTNWLRKNVERFRIDVEEWWNDFWFKDVWANLLVTGVACGEEEMVNSEFGSSSATWKRTIMSISSVLLLPIESNQSTSIFIENEFAWFEISSSLIHYRQGLSALLSNTQVSRILRMTKWFAFWEFSMCRL